MYKYFLVVSLAIYASLHIAAQTIPVDYTINPGKKRHFISPYIYGTNQQLRGNENMTAFRQGGNRMTGYNWENNFSNAGSDWYHYNDNYLTWVSGIPSSQERIPGIVVTHFVDQTLASNAFPLVTLQMAGFVARDGKGTVSESQVAPSIRWREVRFKKDSPFVPEPDTTDECVYIDELVHFLVNRYGSAAEGGVRGYALDNEPALWPSTHPRIHPDNTTYKEITDKGIELSYSVKKIDPAAQIFGPVLYGFAAYTDFQGAPDKTTEGAGYDWFISYYLDRMKKASDTAGRRLLDVLDLHWYPEAKGDHRITESNATTQADIAARLQAPRTLWDTGYYENSWIGQWGRNKLPLIPTVQKSIQNYFPGIRLAFTEYTYGGGNHISGGLAQADVLGIFGKLDVYAAMLWLTSNEFDYISAAFRMYRNYDGSGGTFGDTSIMATVSDKVNSSVYASVSGGGDSSLHIIVINKNTSSSINGSFTIAGSELYRAGKIWGMNSNSTTLYYAGSFGIDNNTFSLTIPPLTAYHLILNNSFSVKAPAFQNEKTLHIYPVPATDFVHIELPQKSDYVFRIKIARTDGSSSLQISRNDLTFHGKTVSFPITAGKFSPGAYIVQTFTSAGIYTGKLLIQ